MANIKSFLINRFLGLFFLFLFTFLVVSISSTHFKLGFISSILINLRLEFIFYGLGSVVKDLFSYTSYLLPVFFLIIGIKKIAGINVRFLFLRTVLVLFSIFLLNFSGNFFYYFIYTSEFNNINSIISDNRQVGYYTIVKLLQIFEIYTSNKFIFLIIFLIILILNLYLFFFSISIRVFIVSKYIKNFVFLLISLTKLLKIFTFFISRNKSEKSTKNNGYSLSEKIKRKKREPTLDKNTNSYKKSFEGSVSSNKNTNYILPPLSILKISQEKKVDSKEAFKQNEVNARRLEKVLADYGVIGNITSFKTGPVITLFEFQPSPGIKTSKVIGLSTDIARSMASMSARISTQPGKNVIGIELPNPKRQNVYLGDLLKDDSFNSNKGGLILALGKNISGEKIYTDLEKMPHLLIAGTTGSGKSVGINSMIVSLLYRFRPSECKLILIDPKMLELSVYENIPHLLSPVVTDPKKAVMALKWVVREMENRYRTMSSAGVKNIQSFNSKVEQYLSSGKKLFKEVQTGFDKENKNPIYEKQEIQLEKMPLIVVVIDEMADLMMVAGKEVEQLVQRLAQMARASGIHLITATQRPSVDVITGTIKANFPSRISFRVASKFDSRTILNEMGAEQLLGSGDMLFLENSSNVVRLHGGFVSESEIDSIVDFINSQSTNEIQTDITEEIVVNVENDLGFGTNDQNVDELYQKAVSIVIKQQKASTSFIQRYLQIGYNRAARIIEQMEKEEIISEANHVGKRSVLKKDMG